MILITVSYLISNAAALPRVRPPLLMLGCELMLHGDLGVATEPRDVRRVLGPLRQRFGESGRLGEVAAGGPGAITPRRLVAVSLLPFVAATVPAAVRYRLRQYDRGLPHVLRAVQNLCDAGPDALGLATADGRWAKHCRRWPNGSRGD